MNKTIASMLCLSWAALASAGQRATEQYIPMGESPGISGEYARRGTVDHVDAEAGRVTISTETGQLVVEITESTNIWLDRSASRRPNVVGSLDDLVEGAEVEVLSEEHEQRGDGPAEWIKVRKPE